MKSEQLFILVVLCLPCLYLGRPLITAETAHIPVIAGPVQDALVSNEAIHSGSNLGLEVKDATAGGPSSIKDVVGHANQGASPANEIAPQADKVKPEANEVAPDASDPVPKSAKSKWSDRFKEGMKKTETYSKDLFERWFAKSKSAIKRWLAFIKDYFSRLRPKKATEKGTKVAAEEVELKLKPISQGKHDGPNVASPVTIVKTHPQSEATIERQTIAKNPLADNEVKSSSEDQQSLNDATVEVPSQVHPPVEPQTIAKNPVGDEVKTISEDQQGLNVAIPAKTPTHVQHPLESPGISKSLQQSSSDTPPSKPS